MTTRLWWSCATVPAIAPRERPRPFTNPVPTFPFVMALDDRHLEKVPAGIGDGVSLSIVAPS
jgi:hypothetical protein